MTFLTKKSLARRTMLKGLGAGIAPPMLDAMMPALSAQTKKAPPRLGFVYASHGIIHSQWKPTQVGKSLALPCEPEAARRTSRPYQRSDESVAPGSRHQGRRQRRPQSCCGRMAHWRSRV